MTDTNSRVIPVAALADLPPTEYLGDTHLVARGFNIIFGPSGSYKSFYALGEALRLSLAMPVVYIAAEGSGGLCQRVGAWTIYNNASPADLNLHFICQEVNLLNQLQVASLINDVRHLNPQLVVVDTLARCILGGDENSAKDMGIAVGSTALIQRELSTAVVWIHHTNRADRGERGSGAIRGAADSMIELSTAGDNIIRMSCSKIKDDEPWPTESYRFQPVAKTSGVLLPAAMVDSASLSQQELGILEFLSLEIFELSGAKAVQIINALNISERSIYRVLSHLKRELFVSNDSKGDPYRVTEKGKNVLLQSKGKNLAVVIPFKPKEL